MIRHDRIHRGALAAMVYAFDTFTLDLSARVLWRGGSAIRVQPKVMDLLAVLAAARGAVVSRDSLVGALWPGVHVTEASLHQVVRKARAALEDDGPRSTILITVPRRGWRLGVPVHVTGETSVPPSSPNVAALRSALAQARLVAVHGGPGIGKTYLLRVALPKDTISIEVREAVDTSGIVLRIARALGVPLPPRAQDAERVVAAALLAQGSSWLALDASLLDPDAALATLARFARHAPGLRVVLATRQRPSSGFEAVIEVMPLGDPDACALLPPPDPTAGTDDAEAHAAVRASAAGVPLALKLMAARLGVLPPRDLAARLARSPVSLADDALARALQPTWDTLPASSRDALAAAAVFPGRFSLEALEALVGRECLPDVERLVQHTLLERAGGLLELQIAVRAFVSAHLAATGRLDALRARWVALVRRRAEADLEAFYAWDQDAILRLGEQGTELYAAWRAHSAADATLAVLLGAALRYVGPWWMAREVLEAAHAAGGLDAMGTMMLGEYRIRTGDPGAGVDLIGARLAHAPPRAVAFGELLRSRVLLASGEPARALTSAHTSIAASFEARNDALLTLAHDAAGLAAARLGLEPVAVEHHAAALRAASSPRRLALRGVVTANYGACLGTFGRHEEALERMFSALEDLRLSPLRHLNAVVVGNVGVALAGAGRLEGAAALVEGAEGVLRTGDTAAAATFLGALGELHLWRDDIAPARAAFDRARSLGAPLGASLRHSALLRWHEGEANRAALVLDQAVDAGDTAAADWRALVRAALGEAGPAPRVAWMRDILARWRGDPGEDQPKNAAHAWVLRRRA